MSNIYNIVINISMLIKMDDILQGHIHLDFQRKRQDKNYRYATVVSVAYF